MQKFIAPYLIFIFLTGISAIIGCSKIFNDTVEELDPNRLSQSKLDPDDKPQIIRKSILESFGNFGCVSCPEAELILSHYIHGSLSESIEVDTNLIIVNYHSDFSSPLKDPWETSNVEKISDLYGFTSLPQIKLNGNNSQYGFREINVDIDTEYHSLIKSRHGKVDAAAFKMSIDSGSIVYTDSSISFALRIENGSSDTLENLSLKILAVKNIPVYAPYPGMQNVPWEVIVVDVLTKDVQNSDLFIPDLEGLSFVTFNILFQLPDESEKHLPAPPPEGIEGIKNYAIIVMASDLNGIVQNVLAYQYKPQL